MADDRFNNSYYTRPSTRPNIGQAIGNAGQNFFAAMQARQQLALQQQAAGYANPERPIGPNEMQRSNQDSYLKYLQNRGLYGNTTLSRDEYMKQMTGESGNPMAQPGGMPGMPPAMPGGMTRYPQGQPQGQGTQGQNNQARIAQLIEELYQARRARGG